MSRVVQSIWGLPDSMKQYDVVVLGATGFTGRLVCQHIMKTYHGKVISSLHTPVSCQYSLLCTLHVYSITCMKVL